LNRKIEPSLNTDERGCYEASLISTESDKKYVPCVITGYPVLNKKLEFKNNLASNVEDWNKFLMISRVNLSFIF
jgi:intraflagellar transport protein 172